MCVQEPDLGSDPVSLLLSLRHAHKNTVMEVKWNLNGNWLLTASRDHLCKLFDIRNLKEELQVFRGHKKEATGEGERREFLSWSCAPAPAEGRFFCPQLWPGILSTKACLLAEVLMALCSSGTLGKAAAARSHLLSCWCSSSSVHACALQGGEGGWRDGNGS